MGNRILGDAGLGLDLMTSDDFARLPPSQKKSAVELLPDAVRELEMHTWPGNLRELEAVLERALLLYRAGATLGASEIRAALAVGATPNGPGAAHGNVRG
jgi:transcriptional regulator with PAS, ATPase and Fis domain